MEWPPELIHYPKYWHSRLRKGFGLGVGLGYQSWLRVRDVPSRGTSANPEGILVGRVYHLLSGLEHTYFKLLERRKDVIDIREGFPILHLSRTLELCGELGVQHPKKGGRPEPFTIDFLVTRRTRAGIVYEARSIKTPEDAQDPHVRRRESVPYLWCKEYGIDWRLVDTSGFTRDLEAALTFIRGWYRHRFEPDDVHADKFANHFRRIYSRNMPLRELIERCGKDLHLNVSHCENEFRYCAWAQLIHVDIREPISLDLPLVLRGK